MVVAILEAGAGPSRPRGPQAVADPALSEGRNAGGTAVERPFPITTFSTTIPFQPKADAVEFVNRGTGKRLAKRRIRRRAGLVSITAPAPDVRVDRGTCLALKWSVKSGTGKKTRSTVLVSPDRKTWWPASASTNSQSHRLDTAVLEPGTYLYKVAVLDGIDVLTSNIARFSVT